ncbi:DUF1654 domain-containing protein [Salinicola aestuarinus]|uniref:DUF1654 domain-containing protein n=1 Tax=Salinicola aestuarinus TaxID=1949082 RepID=UPI000DA1328C|nr:DUF1654 domain-containing protein [Salinicola aestuarinus]
MAKQKRPSGYDRLATRIQQQVAKARERDQYTITLYRFDEDDPAAWDQILDEFSELDYVSVEREGDAEARIEWNPEEAEAVS